MKNKTFIFDIIFVIIAAVILIIINEFELVKNADKYSVVIALVAYVIGKTIVVRYYKKKNDNNCEIN